jgi:hypothetical protein
MFSRFHEKLGTAGFVISIVALVAALTGGAYAAGSLSPEAKKQITKESKKFSKQFSKQFAVAGPQGAKGDAGAAGATGDAGARGGTGERGLQGVPGETGFTETLPSGETETGVWSLGFDDENSAVPLSFNIPLAGAPADLHFVNEAGEETGVGEGGFHPVVRCTGSAENPTAPPGEVCIYAAVEAFAPGPGTGFVESEPLTTLWRSGATFLYNIPSGGVALGTWAVTAD